MHLLIATEPEDGHALLVKLALEQQGYDCTLWYTTEMPAKQIHSLFLNQQGLSWQPAVQQGKDFYPFAKQFDVIWWRRARFPRIPETVFIDDKEYVFKENKTFFEALTTVIVPNAWWINAREAQRKANSKPLQLQLAAQCAFKIPQTLISNAPAAIREFVKKYQHQGVIYKSFLPTYWEKANAVKVAYTARVQPSQLPSDATLQLVPGIFQEEIKKRYELRVTCMGSEVVAAKINSQRHECGQIDWRTIPSHQLELEPYELDTATIHKIRRFMRHLGLVFGCFDFIRSSDGELYFLEVNEQGQFFWIEDLNPEILLLDRFVQFLINKKPHFLYRRTSPPLRIEHFATAMERLQPGQENNSIQSRN